jgi:hypothetical protein
MCESFDKNFATQNISVRSIELSRKHTKELRELENTLSGRNLLNQGPGIRAIYDLLENQLRESLEIRINCILDSIKKDLIVSDDDEKKMWLLIEPFIINQSKAIQSLISSRFARSGLPRNKSQHVEYSARFRGEYKSKLHVEIMRINKNIAQSSMPKKRQNNDDIIDVKPNIFGIGLNLNAAWRKIKNYFTFKQ